MTENGRKCRTCGGEMRIRRQNYHFTESGLENVILKQIEVLVCEQCGSLVPRIPRLNDLMRTIVIAMVAKPSELEGGEVRFLRKYMDETIEQFAAKLGMNRSHLSRIETGALSISKQTDRLVRMLVLVHKTELMEKLARLGKREAVLKQLGEIQSEAQRMCIEVAESSSEYNYDLEPVAA